MIYPRDPAECQQCIRHNPDSRRDVQQRGILNRQCGILSAVQNNVVVTSKALFYWCLSMIASPALMVLAATWYHLTVNVGIPVVQFNTQLQTSTLRRLFNEFRTVFRADLVCIRLPQSGVNHTSAVGKPVHFGSVDTVPVGTVMAVSDSAHRMWSAVAQLEPGSLPSRAGRDLEYHAIVKCQLAPGMTFDVSMDQASTALDKYAATIQSIVLVESPNTLPLPGPRPLSVDLCY
jgi:hypothetical protein